MTSILTLSIGEFELVHDLLSLLIVALGATSLFFLLSGKQVTERFRVLLLLAGIVALVGCYHQMRLFQSWNEAFELAGNSYVASGHFFHELYRYSDWTITMPILLVELILILGFSSEKTESFLRRLIAAALVSVFFGYLGSSDFGGHSLLMRWSCWVMRVIPFLYIVRLLNLCTKEAGLVGVKQRFFSTAKNIFLCAWSFYLLAALVALCSNGFGEKGMISFLIGASMADFFSKCGVSFYVYRIALASRD